MVIYSFTIVKCRHFLIVSAVTNLFVNLIGISFFRSYARVSLVYRNMKACTVDSNFLELEFEM